ncbi:MULTISPECIES: AMP-binding protein [Salegentibacter]|uniref:AMP-binding protein n=1 Tax=Salegentibacter maritimus TaxID=2794347 RepID=A0ABS0TBL8_9FLAO|nr:MULTISPECIES: AMP-binding protein [Salegentibacter]MBE7639931.1 AMP-binding protein [Salegentibacter sp. BLCTC]MBI6116613.1 AMP-binding protein [Salegentibacter maritimus]MBI6118441.1 AMP-binding protein [Salegentibacter maritimus]
MADNYKLPETHPDFRLNKRHFTNAELHSIAYSFIKEGEAFEEKVGSFLLDWIKPSKYVEVKTSGSTGTPKVIRIKKEFMINSAIATSRFFDLPEKTTALLCLPASYIAGKMMLVRAMVLGWHLDMVPPSSNPLDQVFKRYDFCAMTPFQLDNSVGRLHLIKKLIVGGGAVSPRLQKMVKDVDTKVYETYGMTETVTHIAAKRLNPSKNKKKSRVFKVLPNINISKDDRGCLVIKAPKLSDDIIVTNDVVDILTYKKFRWQGRLDNVINSGGIKLHPEQIEKKLSKIIDQRLFVIGMPDDSLGEKLVLFVENEFSEALLAQLQQEIKALKSLEKYERPKKIYLIEKFEETHTGKIHRENTFKSKMN